MSVRTQILDLLAEIAGQNEMALIFVAHDLGVVRYLCDDVLVLHDGRAVEQGRSDDVLGDPQDEYTRRLVAAVPRLPR